ncbi:hypothetical protein SCLCIDRAFT_11706 [Scleroderma citrinum Foug A]|uniref:Uncharacterized protein n=1 Tax=Scleroderma citrinum Foug A TaxID=1036808 RepID=A0A0C3DA90_9AGAM|nr:hypothetical protein SCLCIDRAFT_11706 [Scleroderma citrinum Foug A]
MGACNDVLETSAGLTTTRGEEMGLESKGIPSPDVVTTEGGHKGGQCPLIEVLGDHGRIASLTVGRSKGRVTAVGGGTVCPLTIIPSLVEGRMEGGNCLQEHWWTAGDECCLPQCQPETLYLTGEGGLFEDGTTGEADEGKGSGAGGRICILDLKPSISS